ESCVTVGTAFSYRYDEKYKSPRELVNLLIDVVCRGGNLALNIAPQPNGMLPAQAVRNVQGMGAWLKANGEAIYGTRMTTPNEDGNVAFTKKGDITYALLRLEENEPLTEKILIPWPGEVKKITLLGANAEVAFEKAENGYVVYIPYALIGANPIAPAFRME
ncbi:MAG: alpha-L-fucosidase, partial [Clostridia bacterium]|nr:alpha-L-fucosidase [Clostridia bacterium]